MRSWLLPSFGWCFGCVISFFDGMGGGLSRSKRPVSAAPAARRLGRVLKDAGIAKVILIRHANAKPRDPEAAAVEAGTVLKPETPFANAWTVGDLTRPLTEKGEVQAAAAAEAYLNSYALKAVIASEATRAIATKEIMTSGGFPKGGPGSLTLHTLHPARSGTPECEKMFDKLGYGTLNTFYADRTVEGCEGRGKQIFRHYMDKVTGELHDLISVGVADFPTTGDTVAVFGHAVFLNAVAVAVAEAMAIPKSEEQVAAMELGEAQGVLCDASGVIALLAAPA